MTLTFDLDLTLTLRLTFDLDDLKKTNCFICDLFEVTWRKNVTSYVKSETTYRMRPSTRNIFQPEVSTTSGSKVMAQMWFSWLLMLWPWPWHLKVIWILSIHLDPLHDWCKWSDMFINSGDIAHWLPMLYNGEFVAMETYVTLFRIMQFFARYIG